MTFDPVIWVWHLPISSELFLIWGLVAAVQVQCSIFLNFFAGLYWNNWFGNVAAFCSNPRFLCSKQALRFLVCFDHCYQLNTLSCKPFLQVISGFLFNHYWRAVRGTICSDFAPFWLFYFLLWKSSVLFSFLSSYRLIIGKNSFIYQSHPCISLHLRGATVLSSLNLSSKKNPRIGGSK